MAENVILNSVTTFQNDNSAVNIVNNNSAVITAAFTDVLSRSGVSPNQMASALDMSGNQIINLPPPATINSPARLVDVTSPAQIASVPPVGTSGAVVGLLNTNNTTSGNNIHSGTETFNGTLTVNGTLNLPAGSVTGTAIANNTVSNTDIRQGVAKSVIGVTGNATANVADISGTTRQVLSVNSANTSLAFAQPQGDQLLGTVTNDNASTGNVGEFISSTVLGGSAVPLVSNTAANITSISLTPGDWDVWGNVFISPAGTTTINALVGWTSTVSATQPSAPGNGGMFQTSVLTTGQPVGQAIGMQRISLGITTTVFLGVLSVFGTSTNAAYGTIQARRVR